MLTVAFCLVACFAAGLAGAQESPSNEPPPSGIEEIVVRAGASVTSADFETADSVTGFGAEDLAALGAQDISDVAAFTPNLEIVTSGATTPTFFIRGVGLNDFNSNSTGAVAIYEDGVARNAPALQLSTLFDIEGVTVLRGPQGTGLARNASAGAIKIYAARPTGEVGGYLRADLGNFDYMDIEGAFEAPLFEDILAARVAFRVTERDGTMKNRCGNAPAFADRVPVPTRATTIVLGLRNTDAPWSICGEPVAFQGPPQLPRISDIPVGLADRVNDISNWAARGTLLFRPTLDMSWLLNGHGSRRDELSRLGQSIGTSGFYCLDVENCGRIEDGGTQILGLLGTKQGLAGVGYQAPEIRRRLEELAPCNRAYPDKPFGKCSTSVDKVSNNNAKIQLAEELARKLDSKPWEGDFNRTGSTTNDTYGAYLKGEIVLPTGMTLKTVTSYDSYDRTIDLDLDFSPETLFQIITDDEGWQIYQDVKLDGVIGSEGQIRWDLGSWFLREELDVAVVNEFGQAAAFGVGRRDYVQDVWSAAAHARVAFDFWSVFTLDGGVRYNWERKKLDYVLNSPGIPSPRIEMLDDVWQKPTGTIRLTYRFRDDTHVFWKYTRGWKPGTYNATSSPEQGVSVADEETIDSFETGIEGSWFDGRFNLGGSFFHYTYDGYQLFIAQQFVGGQPEFVIVNAESVEVYGVEVDAVARPWDGSFLNVRFGWLESRFLDFVQIQQDIIGVMGQQVIVNRELQNTGNQLPNAPRYKVSITGEQTLELGRLGSLSLRYDGAWTDKTFYDATEGVGLPNVDNIQSLPNNTVAQPAFWIHNAQLTYRPTSGRFEIAGWARNLTNQSYKTFAFDGTTFNQTSIYFVGDPFTYGGKLSVTF
ncbi:MAG: TonB-dependent receptor [Myxococcales bacterium]|nr:TonB-dependent receptor [Myxococcales bacterium]